MTERIQPNWCIDCDQFYGPGMILGNKGICMAGVFDETVIGEWKEGLFFINKKDPPEEWQKKDLVQVRRPIIYSGLTSPPRWCREGRVGIERSSLR